MAQRSPKHRAVSEKYQSSCMGLISFFDFHQGHPNRKLLSDRRHVDRHAVGTGYLRNRPNLLTSIDAKCQGIDVSASQGINDRVDNKSLMVDGGKTSVKNLMEQEISTEKFSKKQIITANNHKKARKTCQRDCQIPVNGQKDAAIVGHQQYSHPNLVEKSLNKLDPVAIMEALCNQIHCNNGRDCGDMRVSKHGQLKEIDLQLAQMSEVAETFINQNLIDEKGLSRDGASHQSKQFLDALEILNSNKDLFLRLLQDPNSLLVKHIHALQDSQAEKHLTKSFSETKLSDHGITNARQCEDSVCTQKQNMHKLFWNKIKFRDRYQSKKSGDPQPSTRMAVLKPGLPTMQNIESSSSYSSSMQSHDSLINEGHSFKPAYFSFGNIKRKLKRAIGETRKEQHWISMIGTLHKFPYDFPMLKDGGKGISADIVRRNLTSKICSDIGRTSRSQRDVEWMEPKDFEQSIRHEVTSANGSVHKNWNSSTVRYVKQRECNIYVEGKKHLSKRLSDVVEDEDFSRKRIPTTLERILSSREYDLSPTFSSERDGENGFGTVQMRFSPYSNFYTGKESSWQLQEEKKTSRLSLLKQNVEASPCADNKQPDDQLHIFESKTDILENHFSDTRLHQSISSIRDDSNPEGYVNIVKTSDTILPGRINFLEVSTEPSNTYSTSANQTTEAAKICEENGILECSRLDSSLENQPPTSSLVLSWPFGKVVDLNSIKDKAEQPSPVSVLEPCFIDDVTSPASTISQLGRLSYLDIRIYFIFESVINFPAAEPPMQPLLIDFEENCSSDLVISPSDPKINFTASIEDDAPTSAYVRAALQASGMNWDELSVKWHLSDQLLDPSLFDLMELLPIQSCGDPKCLFDCMNEVLLDICRRYFGCSPQLSFIEPKVWLVPIEKIVVHEVMNIFERNLLPQQPLNTLEHLVVKDIEKSGTWMNSQIETEHIAIEMVEDNLEELIMETIVELQI